MVDGEGGLNAALAVAFCGIPLCALLRIAPLGILGMLVCMYVCQVCLSTSRPFGYGTYYAVMEGLGLSVRVLDSLKFTT